MNKTAPISDNSFNILIEVMEQFFELSKEFKERLRSMLFETTYKKGSNILNFGAVQSTVWFMLEGLVREIKINSQTFDKQTTWFWFGLNFIYASPGFFDQQASPYTVKVVKDSKMAYISYENWKLLKEEFTITEMITEKIRAAYNMSRQLHAYDIKNLDTASRYLKHKDDLEKLFPCLQLKYIAEYMGMSADTLGRHRRNN